MKPILAIVGAAEAPSADLGTLTPAGLMAEATGVALGQTTLARTDIDGLLSASAYHYMPTMTLGEYLGIVPTYSDSTTVGGASFVSHLGHAAAAIRAGMCTTALIGYGSTQRTDGARMVRSMSEPSAYEAPHGGLWPIAGYALMAQRHMHEYGTTSEQLAEVAVAAREWALLNPASPAKDPLTVADVVGSPLVSDPLHRLDCCLVTNGGGAVIVTSPERAADVCENPVYVLSCAESHTARYVTGMADLTTSPAALTGPRALQQAGVGLSDIDVFEVYDSFTIAVLITLEGLGLCPKGTAGEFVADGRLRPGGALPLNTWGGGLSTRHPGMLGIFLIIEAVAQLRGLGGARQVPGAGTALVHGLGGVHMSGVTAVLANGATIR
ncbi:thiolase [Pseudonocardia ailaonensis]|uniref:Thiolase n=1 Tax=Pseudonocardia ailaonensis TaxID=367279 RepID=A0ABN2N3D5_9PSEU